MWIGLVLVAFLHTEICIFIYIVLYSLYILHVEIQFKCNFNF